MKRKKVTDLARKALLSLTLVLSFPLTAQAALTVLDSVSNKTYSKVYHSDDFFADEYIGYLGILGSERYQSGATWKYPEFSRITFDVQGTITKSFLYSTGDNDTTARTDTVYVYDEWNLNRTETTAYGYIQLSTATGALPTSIGAIEVE